MSDYVPKEILIQILTKLPVKSLIRATSVCKEWRSLIRSPSFVSAHLADSENKAILRRYDLNDHLEHYTVFPKGGISGIKSSPEIEFPFKCDFECFEIVGSCDGLILFNHRPATVIWNPAIRNHVVLPQPLINPELEFQSHFAVLGFGVANNVYKVVRLVYSRTGNPPGVYSVPPQAELFSLGTGEWRRLSSFDVRVFLDPWLWRPLFFKGFLHWAAYEPTSVRTSILTFHVGDEVFGEIELPVLCETMLPVELKMERQGRSARRTNLVIMGESLGAIYCAEEIRYLRCDVWVMKDCGVKESWTKLYRIDIDGLERVIGLWGSGNGKTLLAVHEHKLVICNAETKGIKHVGVIGSAISFYLDDYKESLVLLGGYRGRI